MAARFTPQLSSTAPKARREAFCASVNPQIPVMFMRSYGLSPMSVLRHSAACMFQSLIMPSSPLLASILPSGLKVTHLTRLVWPRRILRQRPVLISQRRIVWSSLPLASTLPSELKATDLTQLLWPCKIVRQRPVLTSQRRAD
jgi:hypothetical protein